MPTPRKHASAARRQAAYRQRVAATTAAALAAKGVPGLSAIPTLPSYRRWDAMVANAHALLEAASDEMRTYSDERSDAWHTTERAQQFVQCLEAVEEALDRLQDCFR